MEDATKHRTHYSRVLATGQVPERAMDDYEDSEPVASCEVCGMNIYAEDDDGTDLCDQCQWWQQQTN